MTSPWKMGADLLVTFREHALNFLDMLQQHHLYPHAATLYHNNSALKATVFAIVGGLIALLLVSKLLSLWRFIKLYVLSLPFGLGKKPENFGGSWAVITGSSDGIGKEYARQLAKRGLNIALIARNREKLNGVAKLIELENPKVKTAVFVLDFSTATLEEYRQLAEGLQTLEDDGKIGILINNVGMAIEAITRYHEYPDAEETIMNMININITSAALMSRMVLPAMVRRRNGAIINVASIAGVFKPVGLLLVYPYTKLFLRALSAGLADEYESDGITVQSVCPGLVITNLAQPMIEQGGKHISTAMAVDARSYVRWAIAQIGVARETFGHPKHGVTTFVSLYMVPRWAQKWILNTRRLSGEKLLAYIKGRKNKLL